MNKALKHCPEEGRSHGEGRKPGEGRIAIRPNLRPNLRPKRSKGWLLRETQTTLTKK